MKRQVTILILMIFIVSLNAGCTLYDYDDWQAVYIEGCGAFSVPPQWQSYEENGRIYILNENAELAMLQAVSYTENRSDSDDLAEQNNFPEIKSLEMLTSCCLGNSAVYGTELVEKNGEESTVYYLDITMTDKLVKFYFCDDTVGEKFVKKIASSFLWEENIGKSYLFGFSKYTTSGE